MRLLIIIVTAMITGCTGAPVIDLRTSGDKAHLVQRDIMECKDLMTQLPWNWWFDKPRILTDCLEGRGHSVLNAGGI